MDTAQGYTSKAADLSGVTECSNSYFGDPLKGIKKRCWCSVSNSDNYIHHRMTVIDDNNLYLEKNKTLEECKIICDNDSSC